MDLIGKTFSHYTVLQKLGEGGMGVVYKALDTTLTRPVALKFLPTNLAASEHDRARFLQEAKAASAINHPNICTIYSVEEHEGQPFIAMEFVDGQTLRERLRSLGGSSMPLNQAMDIGIQTADALAAALEHGIVHRDIKPENIMIRKDGVVQIMDFGVAKLRGVSRLTREGTSFGTAGYMSPEQVQGHDVDHRSDVFSLGIVLYEMFTGQVPFKGLHETAIHYEIVNVDASPMSTVTPDIPPDLDEIVLECLARDVSERYQSAAEAAKDLRRLRRDTGRQRESRLTATRQVLPSSELGPRQGAKRKASLPWVVSGILACIALLSYWAPWRQATIHPDVTRFDITFLQDQELSLTPGPAVAISTDGSRIVFVKSDKMYLRRLDRFDAVPLTGSEGGNCPFFSPDGRWIGFFGGGKMKKMSVDGGPVFSIADAGNPRGGAWGAGGSIVFSPDAATGLMKVGDGGGPVTRLTVPDTSRNERTHRWPHFLPDGKTAVFTIGTRDNVDYYEDAGIDAVDIETGKRTGLIKGGSTATYSTTGHLVYTHSGTVYAVGFDPDRLAVLRNSRPIVQGVEGDATTGAMHLGLAGNGTLVFVPGQMEGGAYYLSLIDHHGKSVNLPAPPQSYAGPRVSPDGKHIAVVLATGKDYDIWIYEIVRNTLTRITFGGSNRTPVWSPDSKRIAYWSGDKGSVFSSSADGLGRPELLFAGPIHRYFVDAWSRDGRFLVLDCQTGGGNYTDIVLLPLVGDRTIRPFIDDQFDTRLADLSPDGKWIAYVSNESGIYQVYVQPFPGHGGKWQVSAEGGTEPRWSPDGHRLYYRNRGQLLAVSIGSAPSFTVSRPQVLLDRFHPYITDTGITYDATTDDQHFVTTLPVSQDTLQRVAIVLNWGEELKAMTKTE
jgi:serine/threonine protein kinase/dipeptidyl aminopeptidase/acylaminoacyl peptidase